MSAVALRVAVCVASLAAVAGASGCSSSATQVVVAVTADDAVLSEASAIRVRVDPLALEGEGAAREIAVGAAATEPVTSPITLGVYYRGGALGPFEVRADALDADGAVLVSRAARTSFERGKSLRLRLSLLGPCEGVTCDAGQTCAAGGCRPIDLPSSALDPWPTSCNPDEYDCDRDASDGCESDLRTTADCGGCGLSCAAEPNATATCETGVCARKACKEGFFDCDGEPDNGCESKHRELDNCGACHMPCALPNASASCATGTCEVAACDDGWLDVNGEPSDGCEVDTRTSVLHCGSRDHACPPNPDGGRAACDGGVCIVECDPGRADCDDDPTTGCEAHLDAPKTCGGCDHACTGSTPVCSGSEADGFDCISGTCSPPRPDRCGDSCVNTKTSVNHCGECGTVCADAPHASPACLDGNCTVQCDPSYARCDVDPTNGCETKLGTVTHCQGCTDSCLDDHVASGTCGPAGCEIGTCQTGFDDCDDRADDGCETPLDTATDCGACGVACAPTNATGVCGAGGACKIGACSSGWVDFDGKPGNGCERACPSGCGSCAPTCAPGTSCACGTGGCPCVLRCGAACQASCTTDCTVDAAGQADSAITCRSGASCDIDCSGSSRCEVVCKAGSICTVDVKGSTGYDITCEAAVLLGPAAAQCEIKREDAAGRLSCPGVLGSAVKSCAPNRVVCNRGC